MLLTDQTKSAETTGGPAAVSESSGRPVYRTGARRCGRSEVWLAPGETIRSSECGVLVIGGRSARDVVLEHPRQELSERHGGTAGWFSTNCHSARVDPKGSLVAWGLRSNDSIRQASAWAGASPPFEWPL